MNWVFRGLMPSPEVISDAHSLTLGQILNKYKNVRIVQINFVVVEEEEEEEKQAYDINKMVSTWVKYWTGALIISNLHRQLQRKGGNWKIALMKLLPVFMSWVLLNVLVYIIAPFHCGCTKVFHKNLFIRTLRLNWTAKIKNTAGTSLRLRVTLQIFGLLEFFLLITMLCFMHQHLCSEDRLPVLFNMSTQIFATLYGALVRNFT